MGNQYALLSVTCCPSSPVKTLNLETHYQSIPSFADSASGDLHDFVVDSFHSFESQLHNWPAMVSDSLHSIGDAIRHPQDRFRRISSLCQKSLSVGMRQLRDGVGHSFASVTSAVSDNLQTMAREAAALPAELQHVSEILDSWLHAVVQKAIRWPVARWPLYVYMLGAMNCLLLSAMCHLLGSSNQHYFSTIWRFDYAGASTQSNPVAACNLHLSAQVASISLTRIDY
jgi:hypothetical protein